MSDLNHFRSSVEEFLNAHQMPITRFGREAANDAMFVTQLRAGREPRSATRARVIAFMEATRARQDAAPSEAAA